MKRLCLTGIFIVGLILSNLLAQVSIASGQAERNVHLISACLELKNTEVNELITRDLDRDGTLEIIIQETRRLSVYQALTKPQSCFKRLATFELPEEIWLYDFAIITGDLPHRQAGKTMSLIGLTSESVLVFPFQDGNFSKTPQSVLQVETLFEGKPTTPPLFRSVCYGSYFIIPGKGKFIIARAPLEASEESSGIKKPLTGQVHPAPIPRPGQLEVIQEMPIQMDCRIKPGDNLTEPVETYIRLPLLYFTDINQDKMADLVFYQDKFLTIYGQNKEGKFTRLIKRPVDLVLSRRKRRKDDELAYEILPLIKDINGDGFSDVLVSNGSKGICGVYLNHPQDASLYHSKRPDYLKRIKGWLINHELTDLNNDGLPDLVLVLMRKVGIMSGLRILLARSVNWQIEVYLASKVSNPKQTPLDSKHLTGQARQLYPDSPNYLRQIRIPFTLSLTSGDIKIQTPYLISFAGDFNRDGLRDMILKEGDQNILQIYLGQKRGVFKSKPSISLTLASPADFTPRGVLYGVPEIKDFNHDGIDDILIHQEDFSGRHHFIEVFFSQP